MDEVKVESVKITKAECGDKFNLKEYRKQAFSMFSGKVEKVELIFEKQVIDTIIDKFGSDTVITSVDDNKYRAAVNIAVSNAFYAWCCSMGTILKINKPQAVRLDYTNYLKKVIEFNS